MKEKWRDIEGYEGIYQVSNDGKIKSYDRYVGGKGGVKRIEKGIILKYGYDGAGYRKARLSKDGKCISYYVHRLVAKAFIENPNNYPQVNHIDSNKTNNNVKNLEWCTQQINQHHSLAKTIYMISPEGHKVVAKNIKQFSIEMGLTHTCLCNVIRGTQGSHKGWTKWK